MKLTTPAVPQPERDKLPQPAVNLARRATQLARSGNGRHTIELVMYNGRWLMTVNGGQRVEDLGSMESET